MKTTFLGQGFNEESLHAVGNYLIDFLQKRDFDSFTFISAFASDSGIYGLSKYIQTAKSSFKDLNLIVGVDLGGTSIEALREILDLDINSYIFYQKEQVVFHPKIYLFEGSKHVKLIIGSSNLTTSGLFTNVESSVLIEFDTDDKEGKILLSEIKSHYQTIFDFSDPNLFKIDKSSIEAFYQLGIVIDEKTQRAIFTKISKTESTESKKKEPTGLKIPKRNKAKVSKLFLSKTKTNNLPIGLNIPQTSTSLQPGDLVWKKRSLSRSDAQVVNQKSNPTGNLKLSQAFFKVKSKKIDQKTYFRNDIFDQLTWIKTKVNSSSYEEAQCSFDITILGNHIGTFILKLSHDSVRVAGQGNTPTWLHWGNNLMPFLQKNDITNKSFNLYKENQKFIIDIV